jgi:hypothetical protein
MAVSTRFSADILDVLLAIVREALPDVNVYSRIPDDLPQHLPLVVIRRTAGRSQNPKFADRPWVNTQCWYGGDDPFTDCNILCDQVRGALFHAWWDQKVIPGKGWIVDIRESSGPEELSDPDRPHFGRYQMTHEIRIRHDLRDI